MKDYYEILQIPRESTSTEIKKAYFKLVRKYPPDRYPDQFMKIREAYEILSDENTRQEYDSINSLPENGRFYYQAALQAMEEKNAEKAIQCLEEVIKFHPNYSVINSLLGDAYLENENSGKAIRIFEKLVAQEPGNAGYVRRLAHSYSMRGWHRKAIECYREALALDEDNLSLWMGLIGSYIEVEDLFSAIETLHNGLDVSNKKGWDNLSLYFQIIIIDIITKDFEVLEQHLQELKDKALSDKSNSANIAWFLALISDKLVAADLHEMAIDAVETAVTLLPDDPEIAAIRKEINKRSTLAPKIDEIIEDPSINDNLARLLDFELNRCDDTSCFSCQLEEFNLEMEIIMQLDFIRSDVARLKRNYPELYKLKADFFDTVANRKKEQYLYDNYFKKLKYFKKRAPEEYDFAGEEENMLDEPFDESLDEPFIETYTRSQPKVGRNEPCPCGSGKKYKKCCGK
ncbi:MAG: DnaJ domain-containing protein [Bacillota bacterium]